MRCLGTPFLSPNNTICPPAKLIVKTLLPNLKPKVKKANDANTMRIAINFDISSDSSPKGRKATKTNILFMGALPI